jgi:hypothetical protein
MSDEAASVHQILDQRVFVGGTNRAFGSLTADAPAV